MLVQVSSTIEKNDYDRWKKSGARLSHIIKLGLMASEQTPGYLSRIRELEEGNDKLQKKLTELMTTIRNLDGGA